MSRWQRTLLSSWGQGIVCLDFVVPDHRCAVRHTTGDHGNLTRSKLDARSIEVEPDPTSHDEGDLLLGVSVPRKD
jgi:hypothetical protein